MGDIINAEDMDQGELCSIVRKNMHDSIEIRGCCGQRYIGDGLKDCSIVIDGTPGNALGAFLDGGHIKVNGNGQDAVGDTMNSGSIFIDGNAGDALGYGMRGGRIFIHGDAGYRAGVNMKAYGDKFPILVIGGAAGSFLGEYLAGGHIIVLGLGKKKNAPLTGFFCGNGMYNGKIYLRTTEKPIGLSKHLLLLDVPEEEKETVLRPVIHEFCTAFGENEEKIMASDFIAVEADPGNRYKELYAVM